VVLLCVPLVAHVGWMARAFLLRLAYPLDLNWCEGGALYHAYRILHGMPVYGPPDAVFLPFPYPPGHYALLALVGLVRLDFWSGRLLSIGFFAGFCGVAFLAVRSTLRDRAERTGLGLLTVALVVSTVGAWGACADLIRAESVMMGWIGASLWLVAPAFPGQTTEKHHSSLSLGRTMALAAVLVAALYTKQTAILWVAWLLFALSWVDWRGALRAGVSCVGVSALLLGLLQWTSHGWYWKWTLFWPMGQTVHGHRVVEGALHAWYSTPYLTLLPMGLVVALLTRRPSRRVLLWTGSFLVAIPISLLPYARDAGWLNNLGPLLMLGVPATILIVAEILENLPGDRLRRACVVACLAAGVAWLFLPRHYETVFVPDAAQRTAARDLNRYVAGLPGTVVMPYLPFIPVRNGKGADQWHAIAYDDARMANLNTRQARRRAIQKTATDWVLIPAHECREVLPAGYRADHTLDPELVACTARCSPVATDTAVKRTGDR